MIYDLKAPQRASESSHTPQDTITPRPRRTRRSIRAKRTQSCKTNPISVGRPRLLQRSVQNEANFPGGARWVGVWGRGSCSAIVQNEPNFPGRGAKRTQFSRRCPVGRGRRGAGRGMNAQNEPNFRQCRAGRRRSGLQRRTDVQNEANLASHRWNEGRWPKRRRRAQACQTNPISVRAKRGASALWKRDYGKLTSKGQSTKQSQIASLSGRGGRTGLEGQGRQSRVAAAIRAKQTQFQGRGVLYKQTQFAPDERRRPSPRACPERSEWAGGLDAATRQAANVRNKANWPTYTEMDAERGNHQRSRCSGLLRQTNPISARATRGASTLWKRNYGKLTSKRGSTKQSQFLAVGQAPPRSGLCKTNPILPAVPGGSGPQEHGTRGECAKRSQFRRSGVCGAASLTLLATVNPRQTPDAGLPDWHFDPPRTRPQVLVWHRLRCFPGPARVLLIGSLPDNMVEHLAQKWG